MVASRAAAVCANTCCQARHHMRLTTSVTAGCWLHSSAGVAVLRHMAMSVLLTPAVKVLQKGGAGARPVTWACVISRRSPAAARARRSCGYTSIHTWALTAASCASSRCAATSSLSCDARSRIARTRPAMASSLRGQCCCACAMSCHTQKMRLVTRDRLAAAAEPGRAAELNILLGQALL